MKFSEWQKKLLEIETTVLAAKSEYERALEARTDFLDKTLGMSPGGVATLEGTATMIGKIIDMKAEEKSGE